MTSLIESNEYTVFDMTEFETVSTGQKLRVWGSDVSDGHHTMSELYEHRHRLFLALMKVWDTIITPLDSRGTNIRCWKSKFHADGSMYDGWFIAGIDKIIPSFVSGGDSEVIPLSYHLPMKYWNMCSVRELKQAPKWDGYGQHEVLERLLNL